jgi:hypothetical protein
MFDPNHQIERIKPKAFRPPDNWPQRGQMTRVILRAASAQLGP